MKQKDIIVFPIISYLIVNSVLLNFDLGLDSVRNPSSSLLSLLSILLFLSELIYFLKLTTITSNNEVTKEKRTKVKGYSMSCVIDQVAMFLLIYFWFVSNKFKLDMLLLNSLVLVSSSLMLSVPSFYYRKKYLELEFNNEEDNNEMNGNIV